MPYSSTVDEAYQLLHDGVVTLAQIEGNGMVIDLDYIARVLESTSARIKELRAEIKADSVGKKWRRKFGRTTNFDSRAQLAKVLFSLESRGGLGLIPTETTPSGAPATEERVLEAIELPFLQRYLLLQKLLKARSTYLLGIQRETDHKGFLHPIFNLHTTLTYRSSSDTPNFQNMPVRNPELAELIRKCFRARPGHVLVENDFKGIEVVVAACYHKDPVMLSYIKDETKDMHRDTAMQLYFLKKDEVDKAIRHSAKNQFVFPQFYGDWHKACARSLWDEMGRRKLKGPHGVPMAEHLRDHGISGRGACDPEQEAEEGTFEHHVKEVEYDFWHRRFKVYTQWKKDWYNRYLERGWFDTLTGFTIEGAFPRNAVINWPVQGSAFHCLLWSLIQIQRELRARKMRTRIVGQIHDSIVTDVAIDEIDDYLEIVRRTTEREIVKHWKWLIVPLVIECEISPIGGTWFDKREVKFTRDGVATKDGKYVGSARGLLKHWKHEKHSD